MVVGCAGRRIGRSWSVLTVHRSTPHSTRPPAEVAFDARDGERQQDNNDGGDEAAGHGPILTPCTSAARDHSQTGVTPNAIALRPVLPQRLASDLTCCPIRIKLR
jgi:hypothetical protein